MARRPNPVPNYRRHGQSGQAVVTLTGPAPGQRHDVLLGPYGSPESKAEYARVVAEWQAAGHAPPPPKTKAGRAARDLTVDELLVRFLDHAERHYRKADGAVTNEYDDYKLSVRPLSELYGHTPAAAFGPLALKAVRAKMVAAGLSRGVVNQRVGRLKRLFKWAASEELVPVTTFQALATVAGLQRGRTDARETPPVLPVPDALVRAVLPFLHPPVRAMVELQLLAGMRPGEVCRLKPADLDRSGPAWVYRPADHKTAHKGRGRAVCLGPRAQLLLAPYLTAAAAEGPAAFAFSPARWLAERRAAQRARRKTKVQPSQRGRKKAAPKRAPGGRYTTKTYACAVARGCVRAGQEPWGPNRLRHNFATEVRSQFGLEAAQVSLGHSRADVTQVYAERDLALAERVALKVG